MSLAEILQRLHGVPVQQAIHGRDVWYRESESEAASLITGRVGPISSKDEDDPHRGQIRRTQCQVTLPAEEIGDYAYVQSPTVRRNAAIYLDDPDSDGLPWAIVQVDSYCGGMVTYLIERIEPVEVAHRGYRGR